LVVDPGHDVNDFGDIDRTEPCASGLIAKLAFDLGCSRLIDQQCDQSLGIEDGQVRDLRYSAASDSSCLV
jgi:hypothetical protein